MTFYHYNKHNRSIFYVSECAYSLSTYAEKDIAWYRGLYMELHIDTGIILAIEMVLGTD